MWVFWIHGGRHVTAAGVYSLASAVFVGYAGLWWTQNSIDNLPCSGTVFAATAAGFFTLVAMVVLFWRTSDQRYPECGLGRASAEISAWMTTIGVVITLACVVAQRAITSLILDNLAFVAVVLVAAGVATKPTGRISTVRSAAVAVTIGLYVQSFFNGFGRLTVVALMVAVATMVATRFKGRLGQVGDAGRFPGSPFSSRRSGIR